MDHPVVDREEWLKARKALLLKEKEETHLRDAVRAARQALPWVRVEKDYHFDTPKGPLPGLAAVATQQGPAAAANILRDLAGRPRKPFRYVDKGTMAVIGRNFAVTDILNVRFSGYFAWLTWLFVHIMLLVGHRNRVIVLINWAWSYVTFKRGARLITLPGWKESGGEAPAGEAPVSGPVRAQTGQPAPTDGTATLKT